MKVTQAWKKLKKKLRYKRGLSLACIAAAVVLLAAAASPGLSAGGTMVAEERAIVVCEEELVVLHSKAVVADGCHSNVYIGLTSSSELALFAGKPQQGQMIQRLFLVDQSCMQIEAPAEAIAKLHEGIQINEVSEYMSVLSTYAKCEIADLAEKKGTNFVTIP